MQEGYAYSYHIDLTNNPLNVETIKWANDRSRRHFHMTEEERKRDDYNEALKSVLLWREEEAAKERGRYLGHHVEGGRQ